MSGIITKLSDPLRRNYLYYLEGQDIISYGKVCKGTREIASDNLVWRRCIEQTVTGGPLTERMVADHGSNYKAFYRQLAEKILLGTVGLPNPKDHNANIFCLEGTALYVVRDTGDSEYIEIIDTTTQKQLRCIELPYSDVRALSVDNRSIFVGFGSGRIVRIDQTSHDLLELQGVMMGTGVSDLAMDETALYSVRQQDLIKWDKESGAALFRQEITDFGLCATCIAVDEARIYTGSFNGNVHVFDKLSGIVQRVMHTRNDRINAIAVDEERIYAGSHWYGNALKVWDKRSFEPLDTLKDIQNLQSVDAIHAKGNLLFFSGIYDAFHSYISIRNKRSLKTLSTIPTSNPSLHFRMAFDARMQTLWHTAKTSFMHPETRIISGCDFSLKPTWVVLKFDFLSKAAEGPLFLASMIESFKRMPKPEQDSVFEELYYVMKPWAPSDDTWQCAERAVVGGENTPRRATGKQIHDAISKFLFYKEFPSFKKIERRIKQT